MVSPPDEAVPPRPVSKIPDPLPARRCVLEWNQVSPTALVSTDGRYSVAKYPVDRLYMAWRTERHECGRLPLAVYQTQAEAQRRCEDDETR
jgi:hypothetical protein